MRIQANSQLADMRKALKALLGMTCFFGAVIFLLLGCLAVAKVSKLSGRGFARYFWVNIGIMSTSWLILVVDISSMLKCLNLEIKARDDPTS